MEENKFELDLEIDENALDVEWLEQPKLIIQYGRAYAKARKQMDKKKRELEIKYAELDGDIRKNPDFYDINKITDAVIKNTIERQKEYQVLYDEYISLREEYDLIRIALQSVEQRKEALENEVKLHGMNYFAGPKEPRNLKAEAQKKRQKQINNIVKQKIKDYDKRTNSE